MVGKSKKLHVVHGIKLVDECTESSVQDAADATPVLNRVFTHKWKCLSTHRQEHIDTVLAQFLGDLPAVETG